MSGSLSFIPDPLSSFAYQSGLTHYAQTITLCIEQIESITVAMKVLDRANRN